MNCPGQVLCWWGGIPLWFIISAFVWHNWQAADKQASMFASAYRASSLTKVTCRFIEEMLAPFKVRLWRLMHAGPPPSSIHILPLLHTPFLLLWMFFGRIYEHILQHGAAENAVDVNCTKNQNQEITMVAGKFPFQWQLYFSFWRHMEARPWLSLLLWNSCFFLSWNLSQQSWPLRSHMHNIKGFMHHV